MLDSRCREIFIKHIKKSYKDGDSYLKENMPTITRGVYRNFLSALYVKLDDARFKPTFTGIITFFIALEEALVAFNHKEAPASECVGIMLCDLMDFGEMKSVNKQLEDDNFDTKSDFANALLESPLDLDSIKNDVFNFCDNTKLVGKYLGQFAELCPPLVDYIYMEVSANRPSPQDASAGYVRGFLGAALAYCYASETKNPDSV